MPELAASFVTGHVGLNVSDLDRARRFYQAVFGWELLAESSDPDKRYAFLGTPGEEQKIFVTLWQQSDGPFDKARSGLHHLSFEVDSIHDVEAAEARLRKLGATIHHDGIVPHSEGETSGGLFFEDPDGIRLEIYTRAGANLHHGAPSGEMPTCGFF